jgi:nitroreductase
VPDDALNRIFEAARWAASSYNEQPWRFIVAAKDDADEYERLLGCIVPGNAEWARRAPVLMLSVAKLAFDRGGAPNRHALHDAGQAAANLSLQAASLGLSVHQMGGFDAAKARAEFAIPEGFEPVAALAVGYPGDPESLPAGLRERERAPRTRRELSELVFAGEWGKAAPVAQ